MALSAQQITTLVKDLGTRYKAEGKAVYDGKRVITLLVTGGDRTARKALLATIAKTYAKDPYNAKYSPPAAKTGAVKMGNVEIQVKEAAAAGKPMFKPSDIVPAITNVWIDAPTMVKNVTTYVNGLDMPDAEKTDILNLLKLTATGTQTRFTIPNFNPTLVPSEFYEVLTALKLSVLLKANDAGIRKVLGIPKTINLSLAKIMIKIPLQANFPLVDYYISISAKADDESAIKISVKSKVSNPKSNTVKFKDMFGSQADIDRWYDELSATDKRNQKGQQLIAKGVRRAYDLAGGRVGPRAPIAALRNLIAKDRTRIEPVLVQKFSVQDVALFAQILELIEDGMTVTKTPNPEFGPGIRVSDKQAKFIFKFMDDNLKEVKKYSLIPFCYICDKILVESSRESSTSKYNFYQMFFDEVLKRRHVAYAVSSRQGNVLAYNFYTQINWAQEYHNWIALRNQSSTNEFSAPIGLDV